MLSILHCGKQYPLHSKLGYTHIGKCRPAGYSVHEDGSHTIRSAEIVRVVLQTNGFLNIAWGIVLLTRYKATGPLRLAPAMVSHRFAIAKHLILLQRSQTHCFWVILSFVFIFLSARQRKVHTVQRKWAPHPSPLCSVRTELCESNTREAKEMCFHLLNKEYASKGNEQI